MSILPVLRKTGPNVVTNIQKFFCLLWGFILLFSILVLSRLTLQETMQTFEAMDTTRRKEVCEILAKEMKSSFVSYRAHLGFSSPISAADMARAIAVKISLPPNASLNERYDSAMEVIRPFMDVNGDFIPLEKACEKYKVFV